MRRTVRLEEGRASAAETCGLTQCDVADEMHAVRVAICEAI